MLGGQNSGKYHGLVPSKGTSASAPDQANELLSYAPLIMLLRFGCSAHRMSAAPWPVGPSLRLAAHSFLRLLTGCFSPRSFPPHQCQKDGTRELSVAAGTGCAAGSLRCETNMRRYRRPKPMRYCPALASLCVTIRS